MMAKKKHIKLDSSKIWAIQIMGILHITSVAFGGTIEPAIQTHAASKKWPVTFDPDHNESKMMFLSFTMNLK